MTNGGTGVLNVTNNINIAGAVTLGLNRNNATIADELAAGSFTIGGTATLLVTNVGPGLVNNTTFTLFNHPVSGFASVTLPPQDPTGTTNYLWKNDLAVDGTITLTNGGLVLVPSTPPAITNSFNSANGQLTLSWGAEYISFYRLLAQTNTTSVGLTTNWVEWTGASATNKVIINVDNTKGTVFFRLVYP